MRVEVPNPSFQIPLVLAPFYIEGRIAEGFFSPSGGIGRATVSKHSPTAVL